jgi:hypothetical protein
MKTGKKISSSFTKVVSEPKVLPYRHERFAASTGLTCIKGTSSYGTSDDFFGKGMLPKLQKRQTLMATLSRKTELFMLNSWQRYDSMLAIVLGKAQAVTHKYS